MKRSSWLFIIGAALGITLAAIGGLTLNLAKKCEQNVALCKD